MLCRKAKFILRTIMSFLKFSKLYSGMNIIINHQPQQVQEPAMLADIVMLIPGTQQKGIAVAVNNVVIPRDAHADHLLHPDDNILIIKATQGG